MHKTLDIRPTILESLFSVISKLQTEMQDVVDIWINYEFW